MAVEKRKSVAMRSSTKGVVRARARDRMVDPAGVGQPLQQSSFGRVLDERGRVVLGEVTRSLGLSKSQLADTIGLGREVFYKPSRLAAPKTQSRLIEMLEIIGRVTEWAGGRKQALAWYRAQPIPALGGRTAESLVKSGEAATLRDYLDHMALGGYA